MIAATNVPTVNPGIICARNQNKNPLTMNEKSPKVIMLIGRVIILMIGLIRRLIIVKKAPTITVTNKESVDMSGMRYATASTASVSIIHWRIIFII